MALGYQYYYMPVFGGLILLFCEMENEEEEEMDITEDFFIKLRNPININTRVPFFFVFTSPPQSL